MAALRPRASGLLLIVGVSSTPVCGVRDYARVLGEALVSQDIATTMLWWDRDESWSPIRAFSEFRTWTARLRRFALSERPDWILCHYSAFAWGHRGIPTLVPTAAHALASLEIPVVLLLHEMAAPWRGAGRPPAAGRQRRAGWRQAAQAATQRAMLVPLLSASSGAVVTTEVRLGWLTSRFWLPSLPAIFMPVFSNLPPQPSGPAAVPASYRRRRPSIGLFGWNDVGVRAALVAESIRLLRQHGFDPRVCMLGASGKNSTAGKAWRLEMSRVGCADALEFSGFLEGDLLAQRLKAQDVLIMASEEGPSSRKTTLAAGLALGKSILALDGPLRWEALVNEKGIMIANDSRSMAALVERLLTDPELRQGQDGRAGDFYRRKMSPALAAKELANFLQGAVG